MFLGALVGLRVIKNRRVLSAVFLFLSISVFGFVELLVNSFVLFGGEFPGEFLLNCFTRSLSHFFSHSFF